MEISSLALLDLNSFLVDLVIVISNVLGQHKDNSEKSKMFMTSLTFFMFATLSNFFFNVFDGVFKRAFVAILADSMSMILGMIASAFLGFYIIAVIEERKKKANRLVGLPIFAITLVGVIFTIVCSFNGWVYYFYKGFVINGPYYKVSLHFLIVIGLYEIGTILFNYKTLGRQDILVTLAYFILPVISVGWKLLNNNANFMFAGSSVSLLIVNNMLQAREKNTVYLNKELAEKAEKSKSDFLANMSHEIRTPINAVLGLNELIIRESSEKDIVGYANDIKSSGNQLLSLVNDVLDFSKIESGKMELVPVTYDISSMLNDVVNMNNIKAEQKGLSFRLDVDSSIPRMLHGDEVRIKQIITNILSNAVKYTKEGWVRLTISYEKIEDFAIMLKVSVEDTGQGMKPEDLEKLYSPFTRINEVENRNIEGTGLGMAITKHFLELMGSKLDVKSEYGKGSVFSFSVRQEVENWECMGNYREAFAKLHSKKTVYTAKLKAPDAKVLIVDDMLMNLTVAKGLLKNTLVQVETAISGEEALEMCELKHYDIIYLDHMMPGLDGVETFKKLKENKSGPNYKTPIIVLTANAVLGARDEYMDIGFTDYLSKPIDPIKLEESLIRYLPDDLVDLQDARDIAEAKAEADETLDLDFDEDPRITKLRSVPYISLEDGLTAAGDIETYLIAAEEFTRTIDGTADKIQQYFDEGDIRNYVIQVHGLKSTARIVGDTELSEMAKEMEFAGKDNKTGLIKKKTPALLERFRNLKTYLDPIFNTTRDDSKLSAIPPEQLKEAIDVIKSALEEFDFDTIGSVMDQLASYKLPEDFKNVYEETKVAMANVDYDQMQKLYENL